MSLITGPSASDLRDFLTKNNIVLTAAAITIGIASASFIKSFVGNVLMPSVYFVIGKIILQNVNNKLYESVTDIFGDKAEFDFDSFIKELLTWIFIVIGAYLIMDYFIRRWLLAKPDDSPKVLIAHPVSPAPAYSPPPATYIASPYFMSSSIN